MCLNSVAFDLKYDEKAECFIGIGFKNVGYKAFAKLASKRWIEAKGIQFYLDENIRGKSELKTKRIRANDSKYYTPGFHIFVNEEDARNYSSSPDNKIIRVKFKEVIGYGLNKTPSSGLSPKKPCIIARYMKLDEVLS